MAGKNTLCRVCNDLVDTPICEDCWEMEKRIRRRPHIAAKILASVLDRGYQLAYREAMTLR